MKEVITPLLVSRREAAEALSLSVRAVDYLIADGRLKARRIGGRVLIPYKTLSAFAERDQTTVIGEGKTSAIPSSV